MPQLVLQQSPSYPDHDLDINQPYRVKPEEGIEAPNNYSPYPVISLGGMNMTPNSIHNMAQLKANISGREVEVIPNNTEGVLKDIRNCIVSVLHSGKGIEFEKSVATNLVRSLISRMKDNRPIDLLLYSQGNLIAEDVLSEMESAMNQSEWKQFASRINITSFGTPNRLWPEEINAVEHRYVNDGVAAMGLPVAIRERVKSLSNGEGKLKPARVVKLPMTRHAHSIQNYLGDNAKFFLKSISNLNLSERAQAVISSMNKSEYSNKEYEKIIELIVAPSTKMESSINAHNNSVSFSREIYVQLPYSPKAEMQVSRELLKSIEKASKTEFRSKRDEVRLGAVVKPSKRR